MTSLTFNQFQKELTKRVRDPELAKILTFLFECIVEQNKQIDLQNEIILDLTNVINKSTHLSQVTNEKVRLMQRGNKPDGVDVQSVASDFGEGHQ